MYNLLSSAIFYLFILLYIVCLLRYNGYKTIARKFGKIKYYLGTGMFFFTNINVLFFCSYCNHCYDICIQLTALAVIIGTVVYLIHLGRETAEAIRKICAGREFDLIAPFSSIPYFYLINDIIFATFNTSLQSLHDYESKMLIVLLYPFFVAIGELLKAIRNEVTC